MCASSSEKFGNDFGLVHEAVVTGRKVGADRNFWSALAHDRDLFERTLAFVQDKGVIPTISQQKAREIMGKNMFGIEEAVQHFGINPTYGQLAVLSAIPFTDEELQQHKDTHVLIAVFPLSILDILERIKDKGLFCNQDWYGGKAFAKEQGQVGWHLVLKTPVDGSTSKNWQEQLALVSEEEEVPTARIMTYTIIGHYLSTGEQLFKHIYVRTSSLSLGSCGDRVGAGYFDDSGLHFDSCLDVGAYDAIALASSRKS